VARCSMNRQLSDRSRCVFVGNVGHTAELLRRRGVLACGYLWAFRRAVARRAGFVVLVSRVVILFSIQAASV